MTRGGVPGAALAWSGTREMRVFHGYPKGKKLTHKTIIQRKGGEGEEKIAKRVILGNRHSPR